jgi:hypothetical protein
MRQADYLARRVERDLAKGAMKVERVEIVFAGSARQRVKKTSPILLSVPN